MKELKSLLQFYRIWEIWNMIQIELFSFTRKILNVQMDYTFDTFLPFDKGLSVLNSVGVRFFWVNYYLSDT